MSKLTGTPHPATYQYRLNLRPFFFGRNIIRTRLRRFAANVENVRTLSKPFGVRQRFCILRIRAAVGKRIRREIHDASIIFGLSKTDFKPSCLPTAAI